MATIPRISIIVPCCNDAAALAPTLDHLARLDRAADVEVIVAAAGDEARTEEIVRDRARILRPPGSSRAELLNAGAAVARAPILLFLHADSRLPLQAVSRIEGALGEAGVLSGAFEHSFAERDWRLFLVSSIDRVRYRITRNYYGDQGQFVRADVFRAIGGFPAVRLMEDLELSQRLKRIGRTALIRSPLQTSGRRFLQRGPFRTLTQCGLLLAARACGGDVDRYADFWRGPAGQPPGTPVARRRPRGAISRARGRAASRESGIDIANSRSMSSLLIASAPEQLSEELRSGSGAFMRNRRRIVALDMLAATCMGVIALYQIGATRTVPEPNLPLLDADAVDASGEAYQRFSVGDAFLGFVSYGVTMLIAAMAGPKRHETHPYVPLAMAGKAFVDAAQAAKLTVDQWRFHRAFCSWCLTAAAATFATVPLVVPEARAALARVRSHA